MSFTLRRQQALFIILVVAVVALLSGTPAQAATLTFSQSNVNLLVGQNITLVISGGSNNYFVSGNTSPNSIQISIAGSNMGVSLIGGGGGGTVTICDAADSTTCGSFTVTNSGSGNATTTNTTSGGLAANPNNLTLTTGQTSLVTISGGSNSYFVSGNTNPSAIQATLSGTILSLKLQTNGGATLTICDAATTTNCVTITVNTGTTNTTTNTSNSPVSFNPASVSIGAGSSQPVTISGNGSYFISSNAAPNIATISLSGTSLTVTGIGGGTTSVTLCQYTGGCGTLSITVSGSGGTTTTNTTPATSNSGIFTFSHTNPSLAIGERLNVLVSGGNSIYNLKTNSNPSAVTANLAGSLIALAGNAAGSSALTICDSNNACGTLQVTVGGGASSQATTPVATAPATTVVTSGVSTSAVNAILSQIAIMESQIAQLTNQLSQIKIAIRNLSTSSVLNTPIGTAVSGGTSKYKFYSPLSYGDTGTDVTELQKRLIAEGFFSGSATGYYGALTEAAVKAYQTAHGLDPLGNVGPSTRVELNK